MKREGNFRDVSKCIKIVRNSITTEEKMMAGTAPVISLFYLYILVDVFVYEI